MNDKIIRQQLIELLRGGNAHNSVETVLSEFPAEGYNFRIENIQYTPWQLLEHLRIAQRDIIDFIENSDYRMPNWPDDYWPDRDIRADDKRWNDTVQQFLDDLESAVQLVENPATDFFSELPHAPGYTIFREILLIADHNAYHLGQLMLMAKMLNK